MNIKTVDFVRRIMPDLIALGRVLYEQFDGDVPRARAALKRIPDHWAGIEESRAKIDAELAELKAQGK